MDKARERAEKAYPDYLGAKLHMAYERGWNEAREVTDAIVEAAAAARYEEQGGSWDLSLANHPDWVGTERRLARIMLEAALTERKA